MRLHNKLFLIVLLLQLSVMSVSAKMRCLPIYVFGVSASFNDSLVYFTDIQIIDSAWIDDKTTFLLKRSDYTRQLRDYFITRGEPNRTCIFSFATTEKDIMKKYNRMRKKFSYTKKKRPSSYDIKDIDKSQFAFVRVEPEVIEENAIIDNKAAEKARKARSKQSQKEEKKRKEDERRDLDSEKDRPSLPPRS